MNTIRSCVHLAITVTEKFHQHKAKMRSGIIDMVSVTASLTFTRILAFGTAVLVARFTDASTFGEYSLFMTLFILVSEIPSALDTTFIRYANFAENSGKESEYLTLSLFAKVIFALAIGIFCWIFSPLIAKYIFKKEGIVDIIRYGIASGAIYCIYTTLISLYQKRKSFMWLALLRPVFNFVTFLVISAMLFAKINMNQNMLGNIYILVAILLAAQTFVVLRKKVFTAYRFTLSHLPTFYRTGGMLLASNALVNVTSRLDIFFLTPFISFSDLGLYNVSIRFSVILSIATGTITTIITPKASLAIYDKIRFNKYLIEALMYAILQTMIAGILIAFIDPLISLIFGPAYTSVKWMAILLICQVLFVAYGVPFQALLQCSKYVAHVFYLSLAKLMLTFVLLKTLVPSYGLIGGAVAMTISACLITIAMVYVALRVVKLQENTLPLLKNRETCNV